LVIGKDGVLYRFTGRSHESAFWVSLVIGKNGRPYGTPTLNGPSGDGTWSELKP